jgi:hypothetical protein
LTGDALGFPGFRLSALPWAIAFRPCRGCSCLTWRVWPSALGQAMIFEIVVFDFEPSRRKRVRLTVKHHELEARGLREAERAAVGRQ